MANEVNSKEKRPAYKTEEMLKEEARVRLAAEERLRTAMPQKTESQKKAENYWYHYKWHTLAGALCLLLAIIFIKDIMFQEKPDLTVIAATSEVSISERETAALETALADFTEDINGDGKKLVTLNTVFLPNVPMPESFSKKPVSAANMADPQMEQASLMKLLAVVAEGSNPLYLVDDELYSYLSIMSSPAEYSEDGRLMISDASESGVSEREAQYGDIVGRFSLFQTLDFLPQPSESSQRSGGLRDRARLADTKLFGASGLERLTNLTFCLRTLADGDNEKRVAEQGYCESLLENLVE